jgi:hypothetical protein
MTAADQLQASAAPFSLLHELPVLTEAVVPARYADWRPCPKKSSFLIADRAVKLGALGQEWRGLCPD